MSLLTAHTDSSLVVASYSLPPEKVEVNRLDVALHDTVKIGLKLRDDDTGEAITYDSYKLSLPINVPQTSSLLNTGFNNKQNWYTPTLTGTKPSIYVLAEERARDLTRGIIFSTANLRLKQSKTLPNNIPQTIPLDPGETNNVGTFTLVPGSWYISVKSPHFDSGNSQLRISGPSGRDVLSGTSVSINSKDTILTLVGIIDVAENTDFNILLDTSQNYREVERDISELQVYTTLTLRKLR